MNEQAIRDSYELFKTGGYTKSYEEFVILINSNPQAREDSYTLFKTGGYPKGMEEYEALMGIKKKEEPTESISGDGSLDLFEVPEETVDVGVEAEVMEPASTRFDGAATSGGDLVEPARYQDQASRELQEVNQAEMDKSLQIRDEALEGELEAARIAAHEMAISTPEVNAKLEQVNADLIGLPVHGGEAVEKLREIFRGRGFTFEEGMGSWMNVRTTDGLHSIDISLDNFRNASDVAESAELQTFLRSHYNPSLANENEDEISRAMRAQQMRGTNERWNDDGTVSTVKFMSYEQDGVHKVAPTLFPRSTVQAASPRAEDWIELDMDEAIAEAERRGEVFTFDSQEEAEAFAEGSWKTTNSVDVEAQQLYNEHGRDYISDRNAYDNYMDARNARIFLDEEIEIAKTATWGGAGQFDDLTPSEQKAYAKYFREDGSLRADAEEIAESLDDTAAELWKTVNGDDYRIAQEDLDLHLEKRHQALAQEAANENYQAKTIEQGLKNKVLTDFGITLDQLNTYEPKNESERRQLNGMIEVANTLEANKNAAALKYETALTYFDAKANKEVSQEFTNNLEGWWTATSDGYKNGTAAQQLLYLAMGIYDDDESGHERAAKRMTDNMNSVDGRQSRAMSRFNAAEDGWNRETRGALARDPAEVMLTWAASSLSQILPYGVKIIPLFVGAGIGTGAGIGALGANPYTIGAGAVTGGVWGLRTGFAATNLVLEYTNGVLDAGREFGYNMNDPQEAARAFKDERVWERGKERGLKRGIPIAAMDIFMGGLAGRVFAPVAVASRGRKIAAFAAERILLDAPAEATGEFLAQLNVGDEISIKEIMAEFGGAVGNQTPNAAVNIYRATRGNYNQRIAESLMDTKLMAKERASDSQIQTWAKNMRKLGKVSQAQEQRILENVGLRREANELLGVTAPSRLGVGSKVRTRVMELLNVREGLKANKNLREIFSQEIGDINTELAEIARTNKLSEAPTNLDNIDTFDGVGKRSTVPRYRIGNTMYSRAEFLRYIENLSPRRANKILKDSEITNDEETSILLDEKLKEFAPETTEDTSLEVTDAEVSAEIKLRKKEGSRFTEGRVTPEEREEVRNDLLKLKQDAVQESSTAEVDVQEQARDGGAVGEGDVTTETTEEVAPDDQAAEEVEEETVVEVVDKGTRGDIKAFREGTLSAARKNALLAGVAQRLNEGRKLTKFHQEMADVNAFEIAELQAAVAEQDAIALEAADLEASIAADESSKPQTETETVAVVAPYFNTTITTLEDASTLRENKDYKAYKKTLVDVGTTIGVEVEVEETIGGFKNEAGEEIVEISNRIVLKNATLEQAEEYAALMGALTPEVQEATIAAEYVKEGSSTHNANEYTVWVEDKQAAIDALKVAGITDYTLNETTGDISFINVFDFSDETLQDKIGIFVEELESKKVSHESKDYKPVASSYVDAGKRQEILRRIESEGAELRQDGDVVRKAVTKAIKRDAKSRGITTREYKKPKPPEFRMKGESLGVSQDETDTETFAVLETMNETGAYAMAAQDVEVQRLDALLKSGMNEKGTQKLTAQQKKSYSEKRDELNRVREARETQAKPTKINVEELNSRLDHPLPTVEWKVVDGVPMIFNISDQLRTGDVVNPSTGNTIDNLKGGMGFTGVEGHQGMAWASVTKKKAQGQIDSATKVYNDNKEIFTRWWKENPQYKGLVPMAIVKMGQQSILSNEAVVRVLADNISSFPVAKRKRAMTGFKKAAKEGIKKKKAAIKKGVGATTAKRYQKWIDEAQDVLQMIDYINPTTIDDILTSAALKRLKGITSVNVITDLIMTGEPNEVGKAKKKPGAAGKLVSKILLGEKPTAAEKAKLNQGVVTDLITEPQLEGVPQRSVFMIQGVDVLNPAVLTTNHPNYEFGPRGKTIGILEQPESVIEKFPAVQNNVLLGIAAEEAGGQKRSERLRLTQVIPVQAGMANTEFVGAIAGIDQRGAVLDFLNRSFPSVTLSVDTETFDNVMASEGVREYLKGDEIVYGVTKDGDVYLNPDVHSSESALYNTAVHEFGHVWTDYLQTTKKGREIYAKGAALVSQTAEYKNQLKRFKKEGLTEEEAKRSAVNETMAILIGNKGETIIDASLKQQFQAWLTAAWTYIKDTFKMSKDLSVEEIQNLTLDEFLGTALADIMSGKPLKLTEVQAKKLKNPEAAFSMSDSMSDIISRGRAEGFSEASIRQVLRARGQSVANIRKAMAVKVEMFSDAVVPFEFGNVEGGMQVGIALFQQVQAELAAFAAPTTRRTGARMTAQERRERLGELRENHPTLVEISDAALLRRYPRRGVQAETVTTQKSVAEVRAKAMEILRANPTFEKQTEAVQMELVIAMDRTLGITANREVSKQITAIRNTLTQRKRAVREVQAIKRQLRQLIRKSLPKSKTYSQADINKMVRAVERVNEDNYRVEVEKVLQVVEKHRAKMRKQVLKTLLSDVRRGAKKAATDTKKDRAGSLSVQGQSFAEQFKKALILALATDSKQEEAMDEFFQLAQQLETDEAVEALAKSVTGDILTSKQERLVNLAVALDLVKNIPSMELEEVQALAKDYKVAAQRSRQELSETRKKRALENDAIKQKVTDSLRRSNPEMFNEDGSLKDHNELRAQIDAVRKYWQEGKGKGLSARVRGQAKAAKLYIETFGMRTPIQLLKSMVDSLKHLGTFMNAINDTLYEEVFTRLNLMDNNALKGYFKQQDILTDLGFDAVKESLLDTKLVTIKGIRSTKTGHVREEQFSKDQLLRIYALSKNPIQRRKLEAMGFDSANMQVIAEALGKDATDFADKVVQYLSNEYYEQVNDVYRAVNDVNLSYIENYFPTMTTQSDVNPKQLFEGDFNGIFNAESAPALRNRQDLKSDIDLKGATFTTALESHIKTMERYKAYADGTKKLNTVFNTAAIDAVLTQYATKGMVKQSVNNSINPDSAKNALNQSGQFFNFLQTQFTSFALAFRIVQIGKQATSFINAFENYSYRKSGKQNVLIDLIPFLMDYGAVIAQPRKYHKLAMKNSPTYKYRVQQGIQGDLTGLESGSPTRTSLDDSTNWRGRLYRGFKKSGAAPTVLGDLTGVMGYMANYRRNIKNGMSEEKAWTAFNEFNQTQQSRRATEKSILQQNSNFLIRAFTMFGSTPILYINNVMQSLTNIWRSLKHKKQPRTKDVRRLALNLGMANAAFVAMSNLGMLLRGDDEEKEEVLAQVKRAMIGVNLGYQFPFLGTVVKMAENELTGKRKPTDMGVNPFVSLVRKMQRYGEDDKLMVGAAWTALEIGVGAQADPFIALWETVTDMDEADIRNVYDILGYSESYREGTAKKDYKPYTPAYQQELDRKERIKEMRESNPEYMRRKKLEKEKREKERNIQRYGE
mgnify:CR=1 FL=1